MEIKTKQRNLDLWKSGRFGNTLRTWDCVWSAVGDPSYSGPYVLRSRRPMFKVNYDLPTVAHLAEYVHDKYKDCYVNERMPDHLITIQGEIQRDQGGLYLFYSDLKGHMRPSLKKKPMEASGLVAKSLIEQAVPDHAGVIWDLLEEYPDHVIEFSCFSRGVGQLGWPLIVWEVRAY